ncbi:MAG: PTS sugar transporter subunit IIA [[Clostridium] innocuum]
MKEEVLSVDNIQIQERSCDWKSAIETAVKPLIQNGFVEEKYTAAILRNIEAWGPYFMAGPYIILPHARPEEGVRKNQISILSLKKPVYFDDGSIPIRLLMILASVDSKSHLRILKMLASVVTDESDTAKPAEKQYAAGAVSMFSGKGIEGRERRWDFNSYRS